MLAERPWVPEVVEALVRSVAGEVHGRDAAATEATILELVQATSGSARPRSCAAA